MFSKKNARANEPVPRRRRIADDEFAAGGARQATSEAPSTSSQFRRNQTLSSYRHNTPEESSRQKAHSLTMQRRRLGGIFLIVAVVSVLLGLLLWQLMAQVAVTTSTKQLSRSFDVKPYEASINDFLNINPAQRLRVSLDEAALGAYVASEYPEVESLRLSGTPGLAQASFSVTFRTPVAGWIINGKQYYVDNQGAVFDTNYYETPGLQIVDESGISPEQGSAVVGTRLLGFLGRVVSQAQGRGYSPVRAVLPEGTTRQVDVYFEGIATRVKFSIDRGAGEQMEDADRSLQFLAGRGIGAEYIDVRVPGRAAYR